MALSCLLTCGWCACFCSFNQLWAKQMQSDPSCWCVCIQYLQNKQTCNINTFIVKLLCSGVHSPGSVQHPFRPFRIASLPVGGISHSTLNYPPLGWHQSFWLRLAFPWGNQWCRACPASLGCAHRLPDWNSDFSMMDLLWAQPPASGHSFCFRRALVLKKSTCLLYDAGKVLKYSRSNHCKYRRCGKVKWEKKKFWKTYYIY